MSKLEGCSPYKRIASKGGKGNEWEGALFKWYLVGFLLLSRTCHFVRVRSWLVMWSWSLYFECDRNGSRTFPTITHNAVSWCAKCKNPLLLKLKSWLFECSKGESIIFLLFPTINIKNIKIYFKVFWRDFGTAPGVLLACVPFLSRRIWWKFLFSLSTWQTSTHSNQGTPFWKTYSWLTLLCPHITFFA